MKLQRVILVLALFAGEALVQSDAMAQFGGGMGGGIGGARGGRAGRGSDSRGAESQNGSSEVRAARAATPDAESYALITYRLSLLQEVLKLGADQEPAWHAFEGKVIAYAGDLARERTRVMRYATSSVPQVSGLEHIAQAVDMARNRSVALEDVEAAAKNLYQVLSNEQKALADARIPTFISPRPVGNAAGSSGDGLPDLGGVPRPPR